MPPVLPKAGLRRRVSRHPLLWPPSEVLDQLKRRLRDLKVSALSLVNPD